MKVVGSVYDSLAKLQFRLVGSEGDGSSTKVSQEGKVLLVPIIYRHLSGCFTILCIKFCFSSRTRSKTLSSNLVVCYGLGSILASLLLVKLAK